MPSISDNRCAQCGQRQDEGGVVAPMLHSASKGIYSTADDVESYHLDCLPYHMEEAHRDRHGSRIDAAKAGARGDKLRAVPDDLDDGVDVAAMAVS
jgi:hypothetical protein